MNSDSNSENSESNVLKNSSLKEEEEDDDDSSSSKSITSIGIGPIMHNHNHSRSSNHVLDFELIKPRAENLQLFTIGELGSSCSTIYDSIMYLIYCKEHDRFGITNITNTNIIWIPFIVRDRCQTWSTASSNGLAQMFEKREPDGTLLKQNSFSHSIKMIELCRIQTVHGLWNGRATQFVTIIKCDNTCQHQINSIKWMDAAILLDNKASSSSSIWGPEFHQYLHDLRVNKNFELKVIEYPIDYILKHYLNDQHEQEDKLDQLPTMIKYRKLSQKLILDLYEHYLQHTYPSYYMNYESFRIYLHKCSILPIQMIDLYSKQLFDCCMERSNRDCNAKTYIDFHDICYLLIGLDPQLPIKCQTIFQCHLDRFIKDSVGNNIQLLKSNIFQKFHRQMMNKQQQQQNRTDDNNEIDSNTKCNNNNGLCRNCHRTKSFEYGQHCVMFVSPMGRCIEPKIILSDEDQFVNNGTEHVTSSSSSSSSRRRRRRRFYSSEHVFRLDSIANVLFDYLRNRKFLWPSTSSTRTKTGSIDQTNVLEPYSNTNTGNTGNTIIEYECYFRNAIITICEQILDILRLEPILIKRPGPALIMGNINGNIHSLLYIEHLFWRSMPVISTNLIFLGNYIGNQNEIQQKNYSIETLIYLFSIKCLCPNKVILLKGLQETKNHNEHTLLIECRQRYGKERGSKIWNIINQVFDHLPYVCIINESICCTSSGIPKDSIIHPLGTLLPSNHNLHLILNSSSSRSPSRHLEDIPTTTTTTTQQQHSTLHQILVNVPDIMECHSNVKQQQQQQEEEEILFKAINNNNDSASSSSGFIFTNEAFKQFLNINQFNYMIRGNLDHPQQQQQQSLSYEGYSMAFNNKLISINSGNNNAPTIIFIHHPNGQIQLIELDTKQQQQQQTKTECDQSLKE